MVATRPMFAANTWKPRAPFRIRHVYASVVALLVATLGSGRARAQSTTPTASEQALAQALFEEGRLLMDKGAYPAACAKLAESQRLDPGAGTFLNLAICHEKEGKLATAHVELQTALAQATRDGRNDREKIATEHLNALTPRLPRLSIHVSEDVGVGLEVRVDGTVLRKPAWDVFTGTDPGEHTIEATAPGRRPFKKTIRVRESERRTETIPPLAIATSPAANPYASLSDTPSYRMENNGWWTASVVGLVTGITVVSAAGPVALTLALAKPGCHDLVVDSPLCVSDGVLTGWIAATIAGAVVGVVSLVGVATLPPKIRAAIDFKTTAAGITPVLVF